VSATKWSENEQGFMRRIFQQKTRKDVVNNGEVSGGAGIRFLSLDIWQEPPLLDTDVKV
jgi:hypothetical protein